MAVYSLVRAAIRNVTLTALSEFTNPIVIFSNTDGTEPSESYVVVNILSNTQMGHHNTSTQVDLNSILSIQVGYEIMVQISFVGSKSGDMIQSFTQRINNNPAVLEAIKSNKLGLMRKGAIRRSPQVRDTKWIEYQTIDVTFSYTVNTQQLVDFVEGVVIQDNTETPSIILIPDTIVYP